MATTEYDFSDPAIRRMVHRNHQPEEVRAGGQHESSTYLDRIQCETCRTGEWPCPPVRKLRFHMAEEMRSVRAIGGDDV